MNNPSQATRQFQVGKRHAARRLRMASLFAIAAVCCIPSAAALDLTPWTGRPATERAHFQGDQFRRAGDPQCVSPLAGPSESPHATGYYVGGGTRVKGWFGEERRLHEGTWGTDYAGLLIHKKIDLRWSHGGRYQGGVGSYRTDGPRLIHAP